MITTINNCKLIQIPKISDYRGNLSFIEGNNHVPFDIARIYYLYDVSDGSKRGGHAHKKLQQLIIAMSGSFDVILNDGVNEKVVHLNRSYNGLLMPTMIWRHLDNFSSGSVCLVIASEKYEEDDYIRDFNKYKKIKGLTL